jgi:hypothetical protein
MLWRNSVAKQGPPGFIEPCIPTRVSKPPVPSPAVTGPSFNLQLTVGGEGSSKKFITLLLVARTVVAAVARLGSDQMTRRRHCRSAALDPKRSSSQLTRPLSVFDDYLFRVLALRAFESPEIESRLVRLNLCKIHLRGAFWAPRAIVHIRVCRRIFELWHERLPLIQAGVLPNSQPPTPGATASVGDEKMLRLS